MVVRKATIVLDTSAVLSQLPLLEQLYIQAAEYDVELLLPVTTLLELDRIKDREKFSKLGTQARDVINWINKVLTSEDLDEPILRGQRQAETLRSGLKADDAILDCCLYNAQHQQNLTILMSDDHNLRSRALTEGLETLETRGASAGQILEAIKERTAKVMDLDTPIVESSFPAAQPSPAQNFHSPRRESPASPASPAILYNVQDAEMDDGDERRDIDDGGNNYGAGLEESKWSRSRRSENAVSGRSQTREGAEAQKEFPKPIHTPDTADTLVVNVSMLLDWHLRRENSPEDLELLMYRGQPSNAKEAFKLLRTYYVPIFRYFVSRATFESAEKALKSSEHSQRFTSAWGQLLRELAQNNASFVDLINALP